MAVRRQAYDEWAAANPDKARQLQDYIDLKLPALPWDSVEFKANMASRAASATVLGFLAEHVGNMIVSSADLANSDKTDGFLKKTTVLCKEDFTGGFLQVSAESAGRRTSAEGRPLKLEICSISRICASCSIGSCVGPSSPTRKESCV